MLIGYARVSTRRQRLTLQLEALEAARCDVIISERISGGGSLGKGAMMAIDACGYGDILVVWKLDRLSRNVIELMRVIDLLRERGARFRVLTGAASAIDIEASEGQALFAIYAAFAELEREINRERTTSGLASSTAVEGSAPSRRGSRSRSAGKKRSAGNAALRPIFNRQIGRRCN